LKKMDLDLYVAEGSNFQLLLDLVYGQRCVPGVVRGGDRDGVDIEIEDEIEDEVENEVEVEVENEIEDEDIVLSVDLKVGGDQDEHIPMHWKFHRSRPLTPMDCGRREAPLI
jgi:hypothetical protein